MSSPTSHPGLFSTSQGARLRSIIFVLFAQCALLFMFRDLNIIALLKVNELTFPLIALNLYAVACYILQRPRKGWSGIIAVLLWAAVCVALATSTQMDDYKGVFGPFIWVLKDLFYGYLIAISLAITLYLVFAPFVIMSAIGPKRKAPQGGKAFAKGYLLPCLAGLVVAVFTGSNNHTFLTPTTFAMLAAILMAMGAGLYTLSAWATQKTLEFSFTSLLTALGLLAWGYFPALVAMLKLYYHPDWFFFVVQLGLPVLGCLLLRGQGRWLLLWLCLSMPLSAYSGLTGDDSMTTYKQNARQDTFGLPVLPATLIAGDAPNVYIFVYDGTGTLDRLRQHGADADGLLAILGENKFKVYNDTYTIGQVSLLSMSSMYNMSDLIPDAEKVWQANAGLAAGFEVFRRNGYQVESIQQSFMTGTYEYFDTNLPPRAFRTTEKEVFLSFILDSLFMGEFRFDLLLESGSDLAPYKEAMLEKRASRRMLTIHNYYPGHTQLSGMCREEDPKIYRDRFKIALAELRLDMARIRTFDPNAIVVILGDHGSYLSGDCTALVRTPFEEMNEDIVRDRFNTLVAIRWPDQERAAKYDKDLIINQDILPTVFAYLYDSPEPLKWKVDPVARLRGLPAIDHGRYCLPESLEKQKKR